MLRNSECTEAGGCVSTRRHSELGLCLVLDVLHIPAINRSKGVKVFIRFLQPEVENMEGWKEAECNVYMSKSCLVKGYNFK